MPSGVGQRNRCIFKLAHALKTIIPAADSAQLRVIVREWHRRALPHIGTKDFGTSWSDFVIAWSAVKHQAGLSLGSAAVAADSVVLGGVAGTYDGKLRRLAALCSALQAQTGVKPFFLGCREAGEYLHVDKTQAWRLLKTLVFDGVLKLVKNGTTACGKTAGKASEWLFIEI